MKTRDEWLAPLMDARLEADILRALSDLIWHQLSKGKERACPTGDVPAGKNLWDYLTAAGEVVRNEAMAKSREALQALYEVKVANWAQVGLSQTVLTDGPDAGEPVAASADLVAMILSETRPENTKGQEVANMRMETIGVVHARWVQHQTDGDTSKHPLAPLVRVYLSRPRNTPVNTRLDPILPAPLIVVYKDHQQARLFSRPGHIVTRTDGQAYLPGFAPGKKYGPKVPVLPLAWYDLGIGTGKGKRGRGAPLALRMQIEAILNVPLLARQEDRWEFGSMLPKVSLRQLIPWLYGEDGAKEYRINRHWPRIRRAFVALESMDARMPWYDRKTGTWQARRIVTPVDIPLTGSLDEYVRFSVILPPGSEVGPLIDRPALRKAGLKSAAAYRLALGLAFYWHDIGRKVLPAPKAGKNRWKQTMEAGRYDLITDANLRAMAFPIGRETDGTRRNRNKRVREALAFLKQIGYCQTLLNGGVMPGSTWAGWSSAQQRKMVIRQSEDNE